MDIRCIGIGSNGKFMPEHTGRGADRSPEFEIKNLSPRARTIAITLEDLSHPIKNFTHWVIWNIPAASWIKSGIPAGKSVRDLDGACQGFGYGLHKYAGPKPPRGKTHEYRFCIYALDTVLDLSPRATKKAFLKKAEGHILQLGSVTGAFE